jgi:hypothetical protein
MKILSGTLTLALLTVVALLAPNRPVVADLGIGADANPLAPLAWELHGASASGEQCCLASIFEGWNCSDCCVSQFLTCMNTYHPPGVCSSYEYACLNYCTYDCPGGDCTGDPECGPDTPG